MQSRITKLECMLHLIIDYVLTSLKSNGFLSCFCLFVAVVVDVVVVAVSVPVGWKRGADHDIIIDMIAFEIFESGHRGMQNTERADQPNVNSCPNGELMQMAT